MPLPMFSNKVAMMNGEPVYKNSVIAELYGVDIAVVIYCRQNGHACPYINKVISDRYEEIRIWLVIISRVLKIRKIKERLDEA